MRNALVPPLLSSNVYSFGNSEDQQMPVLDVIEQVNSEVYANGSSFYMDLALFNGDNQIRGGGFDIPYHSFGKYEQGDQYGNSSYNGISQQSLLHSRKLSAPQFAKQLGQVRRSHKLSDKITALQKLVSPYGKTDTASVLQEASLYIKLLQQQIQNLFQVLSSSSCNSATPLHPQEIRETLQPDLRNKGLCLVPISLLNAINS